MAHPQTDRLPASDCFPEAAPLPDPDPAEAPGVPRAYPCVVGVGASAGGLQALGLILAALPADFPAPVLIVQHLSPDFPSQLAHILGRHTPLHVKQAAQGDRLRAGWVYVAPPDRHLLACADGTLALTLTHKVHYCRPSADVLLMSVAASFGARSVGVVLTGGDGDGAAGIQAVKAAGGVTIAQDLPSSQQPSMPRNAAATGAVDFVLPLPAIAAALISLIGPGILPEILPDAGRRSSAREEEAAAELASCAEALGVAEEALRVQSDVITYYRLALQAEAAGALTR